MGGSGLGRASAQSSEYNIAGGVEGVKQTLYLMSRLVRQYKRDPYIITVSRLAVGAVPARDWRGEVKALFSFVQRSVRYTLDTSDVEVLITPDRLLQEVKAGDCDDMSLLLATLLESVGRPTRFVACGFEQGELSHVFVQAKVGQKNWLSLDPSEAYPPGWEPPGVQSCFVVNN